MLLCGVDFETTGLDYNTNRVIEIGAVLWDTDRKSPLVLLNRLINPGAEVSDEITRITGITGEDLKNYGVPPMQGFTELVLLMCKAEAVVAHNGLEFDRPFMKVECERTGELVMPDMTWIDTSVDVPYSDKIKTRKLTHLAAEHGFLNPFAHRALSDVLTMLQVLAFYDAAEVLAVSKLPTVKLVAITKKPWEDPAPEGKKETDKARARGFRWDGSKKQWVKNVKQNRVAEEMAHGEFAVEAQ